MPTDNCLVCTAPMRAGLQEWHWGCTRCGYEKTNLQPTINAQESQAAIDEAARAQALSSLRLENFKELLSEIEACQPPGPKLLDVGCAHGWFLDLASKTFDVLGVEPDQRVGLEAAKPGRPIRLGYFPDALQPAEKFDVIVFNDVLEHIPDLEAVLAECQHRLNAKGLLVLNLPSSRGVFYRLARLLHRLGLPGPFERMWQVGLPSPHVHYFHLENLATLLKRKGFLVKKTGRLASVHLKGLYTRLAFTNDGQSLVKKLALYIGIVCALPVLRLLPGDIMYMVVEPTRSNDSQ
ncbi:MAG: class I SAM-dependent methyltransferase [Alcaligenaceae bacterium]